LENTMPTLFNEPKPIRDLALEVYRFNGHTFAVYAVSDLCEYRFGAEATRNSRGKSVAKLSAEDSDFVARRAARRNKHKVHNSRRANMEIVTGWLNCDINKGPWLAGGAVLRFLGSGEVFGSHDFDMFYSCRTTAETNMTSLATIGWERRTGGESIPTDMREAYEKENGPINEHAVKYIGKLARKQVVFNFSLFKIYTRVEEALLGFDFRVCRMAIDGAMLVAIDGAVSDAIDCNLHVVRTTIKRRVGAYVNRGFKLYDPSNGKPHDLNRLPIMHWPDEVPRVYRQFATWAEMVGL